jgi:hypothetical protein
MYNCGASMLLTGFTITRGDNQLYGAGGIDCINSNAIILSNIVTKNTSKYAAGIFCDSSNEPISIPETITLRAYPNPLNSQTVLALSGMEGGEGIIEIYDINGRLVKTLDLNGAKGGDKKAIWDATDTLGNKVSSGIYFARVKTPQSHNTVKLILLK